MIGFKVSTPDVDVTKARSNQLVVSSKYPSLKCDLRKNPKNYGVVNFTIASLASGNTTIYQQKHGYTYTPSFLVAWNYPAGTNPANVLNNATFGVGDIIVGIATLEIDSYTDNNNFYIVAKNLTASAITNIQGTIRFFIYADDFPLGVNGVRWWLFFIIN